MTALDSLRFLLASILMATAACNYVPPKDYVSATSPLQVKQISNSELAYMLTHLEVVAESPLPHELPDEMNYHYRILSYNQQGDCVDGCKPSTILVTIWNYTDHLDGNIQLFRIDGMRFWKFIGIDEFRGDQKPGYFLTFRLQSRFDPGRPEDYRVKIGWDFASIEKL